ncbi:zinc finger CCCH domain-containing protein 14 isoform X1 [Solea senegalensis]|uniref:Zinc finger CCCH domain-containing protein 14 n=1 Tax=Solea senegalensis TaxID=28829 RepID=A0AAV6RNM4_SOLSE|nr:zinc finger CCCH domain-containing protein 14 isoform X1 [Solea senegalensis]KAG7506278.1 zinc finger CCCH domain-containing protein 14 isoform X1 [Solea senegalensis]
MEIGTEISKKIRAAIKGKLQELGAYIDEELPDYIMVMVANKKTSQQMADDLSLFLGNNTIKFTTWLQGVLEKLRTVAVEPTSLKHQVQSDSSTVARKSRSSVSEDGSTEELKVLTVSSSHSDRTETRVSSSAHESSSRRGMLEKSSSRLSSTVKPLIEPLPSEAVIDIKPEMDDDFIAEDPVEIRTNHGRTRNTASRPTAEIYRPGQSKPMSVSSAYVCRPTEGSSHSSRQQDSRSSSKQEEMSRKRKAPASSVVRVNRAADDDSDDLEEEDLHSGGRGLSSRVSLPSKPERKPTLPPAKQANRNLILKAISEAQDSIIKTTSYPIIPQKQTVPVAPRTRVTSTEEMTAAIQLVQEHLHTLVPKVQAYNSAELPPSRTEGPVRSLASRLQLDLIEGRDGRERRDYGVEVAAGSEEKGFDTRSFIMSRPRLEESQTRTPQHLQVKGEVYSAVPRTVQASKETGDSASPKFIVTLDGVPSPLGNLTDCDMELDDVRPPKKDSVTTDHAHREPKVSILQRLQGVVMPSDDNVMEIEMMDEDNVPLKKQKVTERCKFWPVCKSGDECLYHHPTTKCKTFPNCRFGDKCLFIHPSCKYDARCTKPDCPFTHVSRRSTVAPPPKPAVQPAETASVCRFFPECKKMDCPFYHPKPCRFAALCKRVGCTFYHPTTSVPPRHALKWTKTQSS